MPALLVGRIRGAAAIAGALALITPMHAAAQNVDAQIDQLTQRVERLEGTRAVKKLQRAFGFYVDRGLWGEAADLFADDGSIEIGVDGVYAGKERIREYLKRLHGGQEGLIYGQLNEWVTLQPAISVSADGSSATARWRDLGMLGQYKKHAEWRDGIYENSYVKEGGVWKIRSLRLYVNFLVPYERGWARLQPGEGLVQSEASRAYPPDRPTTANYRPFPETQVPRVPGAQSGHRTSREGSELMRRAIVIGLACAAAAWFSCSRAGPAIDRGAPGRLPRTGRAARGRGRDREPPGDVRLLFRQGPVE